jgi:hypothetical protein
LANEIGAVWELVVVQEWVDCLISAWDSLGNHREKPVSGPPSLEDPWLEIIKGVSKLLPIGPNPAHCLFL